MMKPEDQIDIIADLFEDLSNDLYEYSITLIEGRRAKKELKERIKNITQELLNLPIVDLHSYYDDIKEKGADAYHEHGIQGVNKCPFNKDTSEYYSWIQGFALENDKVRLEKGLSLLWEKK